MCFAPQRRALFRHLNFQKWTGAEMFCLFWLRNALRATTACNFWPDGSAPAALASLFFDPSEPQITQYFAIIVLFRAPALLSSDLFSFTFLSSNLSLLSTSSLFCFSSVYILGNLIFKFHSTIFDPKNIINIILKILIVNKSDKYIWFGFEIF